jgi:hypothetical protein
MHIFSPISAPHDVWIEFYVFVFQYLDGAGGIGLQDLSSQRVNIPISSKFPSPCVYFLELGGNISYFSFFRWSFFLAVSIEA